MWWSTALVVAGLVPAALIAWETRVWLLSGRARGEATARLVRRGLGAAVLLLVLILLRYPAMASLSTLGQLLKMSACLALLLLVFVIGIWDFAVARRQIRRQMDGFLSESAGDLRDSIERLPERDAVLAKELSDLLAREADGSERS